MIDRRALLAGLSAAALIGPRRAFAATVKDAAGRAGPIPAKVTRVFPAGPPAAILLYTLALVPLGLTPVLTGTGGWLYLACAGGVGAWFLKEAIATFIEKDGRKEPAAHRMFRVSLVYLAAIFASLDKTNRVLVVHEDVKTLGLGAELSAVIMEEKFDALDAPVMRVTYPDTHAPFSHVLEAFNLPNTDKITDALRKLVSY